MVRAPVKPALIRWARDRAGKPVHALRRRFPRIDEWERGDVMPTLKQLAAFAKAVRVPIGYMFLPEPPVERVPLPDMRSGSMRGQRPSPELLDMVFLCQARQSWYRDYARAVGEPPKQFVGSHTTAAAARDTAATIRRALDFDLEARRRSPTWSDALRQLIGQVESAGVLVMVSGVVLNDTHRKLDPAEFRGFAIADPLAPLVFINGADTRAAQMFTLAHELAHIWAGRSALSDVDPRGVAEGEVEAWCNRVAAELLVPIDVLRQELRPSEPVSDESSRLARRFKVSTLVVLRRMFDAGSLSRRAFNEEYDAELSRIMARPTPSGGDFYLTQPARASRRFVAALLESTFEGHTSFTEACRLLGVKKVETLRRLGAEIEAEF